jgi:hypothetical protein
MLNVFPDDVLASSSVSYRLDRRPVELCKSDLLVIENTANIPVILANVITVMQLIIRKAGA